MSYVEIETGRYVKRWAFWNPATWSIPKLYWDAWSQEQRLHAICRQLEKVIKYADYLGVNVDDIAARLKAIEEGQLDDFIIAAIEAWFEENQPAIIQAIDTINAKIGEGFSADNTIADVIEDISQEIGEGFDAENTIANAIENERTERETETSALSIAIDKVNRIANLTDYSEPEYVGDFVAYNGRFYTNTETDIPIYPQGCCFDGEKHIVYIRDYNSTYGKFVTANETENNYEISVNVTSAFGHGNNLTWHPKLGVFYITTDPLTNKIGIINDDLVSYTLIDTPEPAVPQYWFCCYDKVTEKMYVIGYESGKIYTLDDQNEYADTGIVLDPIPNNTDEVYQGCDVYNDILVLPIGAVPKSAFVVFDITTGKRLKTIYIAKWNEVQPITEIEDVSFTEDGMLYVYSSERNASTLAQTYCCETHVSKTDIFKGGGRPQNKVFTSIQDKFCECANYNGFKSLGTVEYPFKDLCEINLFMNNLAHQPTRCFNFGRNSNYSTNSGTQTWRGFLFLDATEPIYIFLNNSAGITFWGGFYCRGNQTLKLRNDFKFMPTYNHPYNYVFTATASIVYVQGILGGMDGNTADIGLCLLEGPSMIYARFMRWNNVNIAPTNTSALGGYGYVVAEPNKVDRT